MKTIANWGNYPAIASEDISFSSVNKLREEITKNENSYIPRGNGRCYGDASLAPRTLNSLSFDNILSFNPIEGTIECESGVLLDDILQVIVPKGWFLPVTPGTKFITIGGAIASDVHGKNHHVDGSFCDHVSNIDIMLGNGSIMSCSKLLNSELFEATRGGMGLTGIILRAKFTLKKINTSYIRQIQVKAANLNELLDLFQEYKNYTYTMSWIDCLKGGKNFGRSILMAGEHAAPEELSEKQKYNILKIHNNALITFPTNLPSGTLNKYSIKSFNFLYYHKNLKKFIKNIVPYDPFFYPLDKILEWNKGYGRNGFLQYQFVIPMEACVKGMTDILNRIHEKGLGSFLAVFKVFGRQNNLISFPMEGCTLALDFPVTKSLFPFLDELDRMVIDYGGRIYLTKDARMKQEIFTKGYPNAEKFKCLIRKYNPNLKFKSIQSDRLGITI